jgi:hypothetical protein
MATLILNALGAAIGGPIGAAIGSIIGQAIDQRVIFAPKGRQGPRLADLSVQTSTYGTRLPKLFGRNRVSGTVIWSTDLKETRSRQSTGKGQPKATIYSYSASFAVALSSRPAARIGRIWADGKLLRGIAGDFKSETTFRYHDGTDGQAADPLIAAAEGAGGTPAYRGIAYAVFEDFQLADYGNRIPSISFEVIADDLPVTIGQVAVALSGGTLSAATPLACTTAFDGFAATGDSVRGVLETISEAVPLMIEDDGAVLTLRERPIAGPNLDAEDFGASSDDKKLPRVIMSRRAFDQNPSALAIRHYDPARDYQPGLQRVWRTQDGRADEVIDLPASLSASAALTLAEARMAGVQARRHSAEIILPWRYARLRPSQRVVLPGDSRAFVVDTISFEGMALKIGLSSHTDTASAALSSAPGRSIQESDALHGSTLIRLIDLPMLQPGAATAPQIFAVAAGFSPGWRRAQMLLSSDDGASWEPIGQTAAPAVLGHVALPLPVGQPYILDTRHSLTVTLLHAAMALQPCDDDGLIAGRNTALVGQELIQFQFVEPLAPGVFRLTGLLRGRRGTEWAMDGHAPNEGFVLLDSDAMAPITAPVGAWPVRVMASGLGDLSPAESVLFDTGSALLPLSPIQLRTERMANGDTRLHWVRRSRDGWRWVDGVDAPLSEEIEQYAITIVPSVGPQREVLTGVQDYLYSAAARAADVAGGASTIIFSVVQRGTFGVSRPALITLNL